LFLTKGKILRSNFSADFTLYLFGSYSNNDLPPFSLWIDTVDVTIVYL